jgi:hypothetical protein
MTDDGVRERAPHEGRHRLEHILHLGALASVIDEKASRNPEPEVSR